MNRKQDVTIQASPPKAWIRSSRPTTLAGIAGATGAVLMLISFTILWTDSATIRTVSYAAAITGILLLGTAIFQVLASLARAAIRMISSRR